MRLLGNIFSGMFIGLWLLTIVMFGFAIYQTFAQVCLR